MPWITSRRVLAASEGVETIAVDRYDHAPGHQVAHHQRTITMSDPGQLRALIEAERPDVVVPEIEAIATATLVELEAEGVRVVPTARAARLTMDREGIRRLAAEDLGLPTSAYRFCDSLEELRAATAEVGFPCVVKPVMSSSGKGQSKLDGPDDLRNALLRRPDQFVQNFTERLLTYALGRKLEHFDMPEVRRIVRTAAENDYKFSSIVWAVIQSDAFMTRKLEPGELETTAQFRPTD